MLNLSILSDKIWIHRSPWYLDIWNNLNSISILHSRLAVKILKGRFWNIASVYSQLHFKLHVVKSTNNNTQYHSSISQHRYVGPARVPDFPISRPDYAISRHCPKPDISKFPISRHFPNPEKKFWVFASTFLGSKILVLQ